MTPTEPAITGATLVEAERQSNELGLSTAHDRLAEAGVDPAAVWREAEVVADVIAALGPIDRAAVVAAFAGGLELGVRAARLAS